MQIHSDDEADEGEMAPEKDVKVFPSEVVQWGEKYDHAASERYQSSHGYPIRYPLNDLINVKDGMDEWYHHCEPANETMVNEYVFESYAEYPGNNAIPSGSHDEEKGISCW